MVDLLIGIIVVAGVVFLLRLFFKTIAKQEKEQKTFEAKALEDFCKQHEFNILQNSDKQIYWERIEPSYIIGALGQLFTSETGIYPHIGFKQTKSGNEYVVLRRSGRHQSSGSRRYMVGAFLENGVPGFPEMFIAPLSFLTSFMSKKNGWIEIDTQKPYRAYVRNSRFSDYSTKNLLNTLTRMGKPYLSIFVGNKGLFVYFEMIGKWPASVKEYDRVLQSAHRLRNLLHGKSE